MAQASPITKRSKRTPVSIHIRHRLKEVAFIVCLALAAYLLLSLSTYTATDPGWSHTGSTEVVHNKGGKVGAWLADLLLYLLGHPAYLLPATMIYSGYFLLTRSGGSQDRDLLQFWVVRIAGFILALGAACGLAALHFPASPGSLPVAEGGILGKIVGYGLLGMFGSLGTILLLLALLLTGVTLLTGLSWVWLMDITGRYTLELFGHIGHWGKLISGQLTHLPKMPEIKRAPDEKKESKSRLEKQRSKVRIEPVIGELAAIPGGEVASMREEPAPPRMLASIKENPAPIKEAAPIGREVKPRTEISPRQARQQPPPVFQPSAGEGLPVLSLLDKPSSFQGGYTKETLERLSCQVEEKLKDFGVEVHVVAVHPGPVITSFELRPAPGVKVSRISGLAKDLARALSVLSVRVVEVIPGKPVVGLEIPNETREIVYLSEVLHSAAYLESRASLTLALGKDISGHPVVADLAKMPHLLVAGATGSGKSVAINAMILSLLYKATPQQVRLILIDPKMLELSVYEGIPHLLAPVVIDMSEAGHALRWCVAEMERRYRLMAALGVRNLAGFNRKVREAIRAGEPLKDPLSSSPPHEEPLLLEPLPLIVVVIDELADMMMVVGKKVEELIARLAQKARASGIHLILATQRPSVDVITGLIKANIPARMAFQVASRVDSRTILDQMGAEQLLGQGDMLYLPPGTAMPGRIHGVFVDDHEVHNVVEFLKQQGAPQYLEEITQGIDELGEGANGSIGSLEAENDPLYDQAVRVVTETQRASVSGVQRRLRIGYNRAARLVEAMEHSGVVSTMQANGSREVLAPPPPEN
ncbi:DNA translocase FtsK [Nitrosococcus watsonii]|uniref:DNA translocase FtsK n=1 Tax=Nitrosococcus watsoni (strain C-113) TaxID=105559 RepID=D8KAU5_NITWC|nr:DNA translocase FtsK [Nitrosococcus watsonii]ADJ29522.1 cell division protein FtsK/SpoIIIE [Nitrosococcus watsonii C-113]